MTGTSFAEDVAALWAEPKRSSSSHRLMLFALLISVSAHMVIAVWYQPEPAAVSQTLRPKETAIRISLSSPSTTVESLEPENIEPTQPVEPALPDTSTSVPPATSVLDPTQSIVPQEEKDPPKRRDIQAIIRESSVMPDHYRLSEDDQAPFQRESDYADGIFDPRLRKKLQDDRSRRTGLTSAATELTTLRGETVVTVAEGRCMTSDNRSSNLTRASDWYFTHCDGYQTEGESMMERVNQQMKSRR